MAQQTIGLGTTANDGTGDDLRAGGGKINDNFDELYTADAANLKIANNLSDLADAAAARGNLLVCVPAWDFNFTGSADAYVRASVAMTVTEMDTTGTGTIAYQKSTAAAPDTFAATASPIVLEAGAKLKVSASAVTGSVAVHLERTA